jgi:hypothetical protein
MTDNAIAVLRIELQDIKSLIWRRVAVPTSMNLKAVHGVIQAVMGWLDCHLWQFEGNGRKYSLVVPDDPDWNDRITDAAKITLATLVADGMTDMTYVYDMGDNWQHRIVVEKVSSAATGARYPQFLGGERRCPPEDCGGVPGYYEFLDNIASRQSKKRKAALDWYGGPYDPDDIDEKQIVAALKCLAIRGRPGRSKAE